MNAPDAARRFADALRVLSHVVERGTSTREGVLSAWHDTFDACIAEGLLVRSTTFGPLAEYRVTDKGRAALVASVKVDDEADDEADDTPAPRPAIPPPPDAPPAPSADDLLARILERLTDAPTYGDAPRVSVETRRDVRGHQSRARASSEGRRWKTPWCDSLAEALEELLAMIPHGPPRL